MNDDHQYQQQLQEEQENGIQMLRSIHNRHSSFVKFINKTRHNVGVYWIDYQGNPVRYKVLGLEEEVDINTFVTHPWIFVEESTQDRFTANGKEVYFPQPWYDQLRRMHRLELPTRIERNHVHISLPMYSLRELCLREIKHKLSFDYQAFSLQIPNLLQRELYHQPPRKPSGGRT